MALLQTVKSLINQRLCAAAEEIFVVIERILTDYEHHAYCSKQQRTVLDMVLNADINHRAGFLHLPVCTQELSTEHQEMNSSLVQEEPEPPPHIKEEQQSILQGQEEVAAEPQFTLLTVKLEEDEENDETEPLACTSMDHTQTQTDVEDYGVSQPTRDDQLLSPHCSKSDTEDSEEWEETREGQPSLNKTLNEEGQRLALTDEPCEDLQSTKQTLFTRSHGGKDGLGRTVGGEHFSLKQHIMSHARFTCTVCRRSFSQKSILDNHMMIHSVDKPFICTVCEQSFKKKYDLKVHMRIHTGERPFTCIVCERSFNRRQHLKGHMKIHTLQ